MIKNKETRSFQPLTQNNLTAPNERDEIVLNYAMIMHGSQDRKKMLSKISFQNILKYI